MILLDVHVMQASVIIQWYLLTVMSELWDDDRALEGDHITFTCPSGLIHNGPNSSMCMGNGEWEPDSREVYCISEFYITTGVLQ